MVYTTSEIAKRIKPVAIEFNIPAVYLFGSYARDQATEDSDIDLLIDTTGTGLTSLLKLGALHCALEDALQKPIDLITVGALLQTPQMESNADFRDAVMREKVLIYQF